MFEILVRGSQVINGIVMLEKKKRKTMREGKWKKNVRINLPMGQFLEL